MLFSPHLSSHYLAEFTHRLAIELDAGIDVRRVWQREAELAPRRLEVQYAQVRDAVAGGETLTAAMASTGKLFPRLLLEMVDVGEKTGTLGEVFRRLEKHYRHKENMRRTFLGLIAWPMIQLLIAITVIGLMILVMGAIAERNQGEPIDILGFGLVGTTGFVIYVNFIIAVALVVAGLVAGFRRGMLWTKPLQRFAMRIPFLGGAFEKLCLAQLTWAMHLTLNVEMDLRRLIPLVLRATGCDYYEQAAGTIVASVVAGNSLHESFAAAEIFPARFLEALEVAEESGSLVEGMGRLSRIYEEEAEGAMKTLSIAAGVAVWLLVAGLIIMMIFRIFGFYLGVLNDALEM